MTHPNEPPMTHSNEPPMTNMTHPVQPQTTPIKYQPTNCAAVLCSIPEGYTGSWIQIATMTCWILDPTAAAPRDK